jgi:putative acetyltransferase
MENIQEITISPFRPEDQDATRQLILQGLGEHWGWIDESKNPDLDDITSAYAEGLFLLAWDGQLLVGTGALIPEAPSVGRIVRMSVLKSYRRRQIGSRLLNALLAGARYRGCKQVVLETTDTWDEVISFYLRNGFVEQERKAGDIHLVIEI